MSARILFVNNFGGPGIGGGEVQLLALMRACIAAGMDVDLVCQPDSELARRASEAGARVHQVGLAPTRLPLSIARVRRIARVTGARIVQGTGYLTNLIVRVACAGLPVAVVNTQHTQPDASLHDGGARGGLALRFVVARLSSARVDRYVAVSHAVASELARDGGIDGSRITVIHNGIDAAALAREARVSPQPVTAALAAALGPELPAVGDPLVGVVARLEAVKGVDDFIRAAVRVCNRDPRPCFAIVGEGSKRTELAALLEELTADDSRAHGRIGLLGNLPSVALFLAACDIVVQPSRSEAFGLVALEAMALGKPVVATRVGGVSEVVVHDVTGLLVPAGDPEALASAIVDLIADPARAAAMGAAGREIARRDFSAERMGRAYLDLYAELLGDMAATSRGTINS